MISLRHLPISNKLSVLLLLFVLGLTAYVSFVYRTAHAMGDNTRLAGSAFPLLQQIGDCSRLTTEMRDAYAVAVTAQDPDMLADARSRASEVTAAIAQASDNAKASGVEISALGPAFNAYYRAADAWARDTIAGSSGSSQARLYALSQQQAAFSRQLEDSRQQVYEAFAARLHNIEADADRTWEVGLFGGLVLSVVLLALGSFVTRRMLVQPVQGALAATARIAEGDWDEVVEAGARDELGQLLAGIETLRQQLRARREADLREEALARVENELNLQMRGDFSVRPLCDRVIRYLTPALGCEIGLVYVAQDHMLVPAAACALRLDGIPPLRPGQSLVGQAVRNGKATVLHDLPDDYCRSIDCGSARLAPRSLAIVPVQHNGELLAVLELGSLQDIDEDKLALLTRCCKHFAVVLKVALTRQRQESAVAARRSDALAPQPS